MPLNSSGIVALFEEQWANEIEKALPKASKVTKEQVDGGSAAEVKTTAANSAHDTLASAPPTEFSVLIKARRSNRSSNHVPRCHSRSPKRRHALVGTSTGKIVEGPCRGDRDRGPVGLSKHSAGVRGIA